jgi:thiamine-phosphate pyrophosphorylase
MSAGAWRRARLARAHLYLVIESEVGDRPADAVVAPALEGGVDLVQLREKAAPDRALVEAGRRLRALCHSHGALLIVNDRADLALACGADGVHVGQEDDPPDGVREVVGPDLLIGVSTHSPEQITAARETAADYLGVGPVFATATKPGVRPVGLELVRHAAAHAGRPFFAIGGIDAGNAREVAGAGAERIAVVRAIRDAQDPRLAAAGLRAALTLEGAGVS